MNNDTGRVLIFGQMGPNILDNSKKISFVDWE